MEWRLRPWVGCLDLGLAQHLGRMDPHVFGTSEQKEL